MLAPTFDLSRHARKRCQQRCVSHALVGLVLLHADRRVFVGGGVQASMITRKRLKRLGQGMGAGESERLRNLVVLHHPAARAVVSVLWADGKAARRYRRHT